MIAADLIRTVERAGGHLEPDGDGLVVEAPKPLPEPIMTELRAHKAEVIDFLNRPVARVVLLAVPPGVPEAWSRLRPPGWWPDTCQPCPFGSPD